MKPDQWELVSQWLNAWLTADPIDRGRLRAQWSSERPDLIGEFDALAAETRELPGFLETPALVLAATELAQEDEQLAEGLSIGPYRIERFLARGGMGDVYRAADTRLERAVAIKVLARTKTGDPQRVARFMQEARVTASLDHPNIVKIYDVGRFEDRAYLVAEFLEGETLRARIDRGALPADDVVRVADEIARGLQVAHAAGLVHRDLKPDNIFLTRAGTTKILDFGIAKLAQDESVRDGLSTLTGVVLGTAGYLAPEQIRGAAIDARADLFALGALMFEMLTGRRVFGREHTVETLHATLHDTPPDVIAERPDVPPALATIVMRLLEKSPGDRFQSATALIGALDGSSPIDPRSRTSARRRVTPRPGARVSSRFRRGWIAAALLAVAALVAVISWWGRRPAGPASATAPSVVLAVMPFRSIPAASGNELLEIGLADVFVSRLGQLADVRVLPLAATERTRDREPREAARSLNATHVLTVSLLRDQQTLRAVPQLMAVADGRNIWSTNFDVTVSTVFSLQDIIVNRVIEELAPRLSPGARSTLARAGTRNSDASDAYLRGRVHVRRPTPEDLMTAAKYFEQATKLDPRYADAWAGLGSAYKRLPVVMGAPGEAFASARDAANRALEIDRDHAEATSVLGTVAFWYDWDYSTAETHLRRALALHPSSEDSQVFLAHLYSNLGRREEALLEIRRAQALAPGWPVPLSLEGQFLFMARRYEEAIQHLNKIIEVYPTFWNAQLFRLWAFIGARRYNEVVADADKVFSLHPKPEGSAMGPLAMKGYALVRLGQRAEAEAVLAQLRTVQQSQAILLHALGRDDEALAQLRTSAAERRVEVTFLGVDPRWDDLRDNPAFREILERVNLLEVSDRVRRK